MPTLLLDKPYHEAADGLMAFVKDATREERASENGAAQEIVIEGDFQVFALSLMEMWGGRLRFVIRDTEAKDEEAIAARGQVAMYNPALAHMMTAKSQMRVYKRQEVTIRTIKLVDGREVSREESEQEEWPEVTEEFERIAMREAFR